MKRVVILVLVIFCIVFAALQFIRPEENRNLLFSGNDITKTLAVPNNVRNIFKKACYDCHSNNTVYPWYSKVQPVGWLLAKDIKEGKAQLNFSEFGSYSLRRRQCKLNGISNSINDDIMPLSSYRLMHKSARLTLNEKTLIINWSRQTSDSLNLTR